MIQISKTEQILKEVIQYNIDVTAISETRWLGSGVKPLQGGYVLTCSGHERKCQAGVGVLMSPTVRRGTLKWKNYLQTNHDITMQEYPPNFTFCQPQTHLN